MKIVFDGLETKELKNFKGGEGALLANMQDDGSCRILRGRLAPGSTIGLHRHEDSAEIIYILSGKGRAVCNGEDELLAPGNCHYCPKGSAHTLLCEGEETLCFIAVVPQQ